MKYLSDKQVSERYDVSRATVWRWVRNGAFPSPIKITAGCTRWKLADLEAWESKQEGAA
ncbi:AlpA family transcriptional regulator [Halovibrio salipaludis]|uniref:AlpA family transcriptional regulator n=1 Tax=Halovibrio salipaludis TaxID=2032626 RepID=A0A2A2F648_9GAMM|nr:helix-turn-helix domain-containing protein [Halovibrio salipaludis]PAU81051.1 AlpA family transcriptional regulator [Halovibrio salipaludis]